MPNILLSVGLLRFPKHMSKLRAMTFPLTILLTLSLPRLGNAKCKRNLCSVLAVISNVNMIPVYT